MFTTYFTNILHPFLFLKKNSKGLYVMNKRCVNRQAVFSLTVFLYADRMRSIRCGFYRAADHSGYHIELLRRCFAAERKQRVEIL